MRVDSLEGAAKRSIEMTDIALLRLMSDATLNPISLSSFCISRENYGKKMYLIKSVAV